MTKIEWAHDVWNPVWGCLNKCPYCYARKISKRFGKKYGVVDFKPTWIESNYNKSFPKKPSRIFVNSMSDISYWEDWMIERTIARIHIHDQHQFLFLTKDTDFYHQYFFPENCWLGYTFNKNSQVEWFSHKGYYPEHNKFFISLEPIQEEIKIPFDLDWLIIGAESGNRKNKIIPEKEWVEDLIKDSKLSGYPVFLKDNLKDVLGLNIIQEFPNV